MGATASRALRALQYFLRAIEFACAALILALYSYFLATLSNHSLPISTSIRAVEGISGAGVLYTILAILFLCCAPGHPFLSFILMVLDVCFAGAFIYVAAANKDGASSCNGEVSTAFGKGNADTNIKSEGDGWLALPSLRLACKMESACLAVAIVAVIFFLLSVFANLFLARARKKEKRIGPSPANNYTSGYGKSSSATTPKTKRFSFLSRLGRKDPLPQNMPNEDYLPTHATPDDMRNSFATSDQTRVNNNGSYGNANGYGNLNGMSTNGGGGSGYGNLGGGGGGGGGVNGGPDKYQPFVPGSASAASRYGQTHPPPPPHPSAAHYRHEYDDGVYDRVPL